MRRKSWRVPNKVFRVQVALDKTDAALRPAMRFRGEIQTERVKSVLTLPRDAVFQRPGGPVCWVRGFNGFNEVNVDTNAGTVTVRARFPNRDGVLLPGMFVRVETPQGKVPQGILAPQQGVTRDPKGDATALPLALVLCVLKDR